ILPRRDRGGPAAAGGRRKRRHGHRRALQPAAAARDRAAGLVQQGVLGDHVTLSRGRFRGRSRKRDRDIAGRDAVGDGNARVGRTMTIHDDLNLYLRARVPMIVLVTVEEQRAVEVLDEVRIGRDASARSDLITWDIARGLTSRDGRAMPAAATPDAALDKIAELTRKNPDRKDLYVLKDFHEFWDRNPTVKRKLRNLAHALVSTYSSLVVTTHSPDVPAELADDVVVLDMPLPNLAELRADLDGLIEQTKVE